MADLPIVVAGAGPTGLMCALALARQDIPVIVLESEPALSHDLRAGTYHPPTLEMMAPYGITARMHEIGLEVRHWQIRDKRGELVAEFDLGLLADVTPYPYRFHLEQHRLTPIQLDTLRRESGAEVRFGWRLTGFTQQADRVRVEIAAGETTDTIAAAWLIGADGGRSTVRKCMGVEFEGFT
ncbi:MAG TPA: FAD-dependent monooxygenase [Xanthobacteraceae bacterium]